MIEKILNKFFRKEDVFFIGSTDILPPPLKKSVEEDLVKKSNMGDLKARNKLIEHNLRLVVFLAKKYDNTIYDLEDLVSIGTIGLIKGIKTYKLEDKNGETFVINNNIGVNESLGMLLVRNKYIPDDSIEYFVDYASKSISFTDTTKLHNKIVQILKYKKYKGAAVTDKNIAKFHGKCEDLLKKLKVIQQNINPEVENDYISVFPTFEFEDIIFKIDPSEKFSDMREFRHNRKNKLKDLILELEQEIKIEDDEYMYGDLLKQIENIKSIIEDIFK